MSAPPNKTRQTRTPVLIGLVLAAGVALFFALRSSHKQPLEIERSALVLREGKLYRTNNGALFTGIMLERYPSGQVLSRSSIVNGLLDGTSQGFYTNGHLQVIEHFAAGQSEGKREKFYGSGAKLSEATIHDGKLTGVFRQWHENGVLSEEIQMKDGVPDGSSTAYYPSGYLKAEARHEKGKLLHQKFWKEGEGTRLTNASSNRIPG